MDSSTYLPIARLDELAEDAPAHASADGIDLVPVRRGAQVHVFEGRCPHRGALLADGRVEGANLICRVHGWDYRLDTGVSAYNPTERIYKFGGHVQDGEVLVDKADLVEYRSMRPERAVSSTYDRLFDDPHQDTVEEPFVSEIHALARGGLSGAHGKVEAIGAFRRELDRRELVAVGLLQATSLPFLLAAVEIGREMNLLDPALGAGLVAAGLVSVLIFPAAALTLLPRPAAVAV
jgi:methylamine---glutamate N-methyltransferase subunit C